METIPLDDAPTYNIFLNKNTAGIFQMEESLMTEYASRCKPKSLMEISNVISLVRPGSGLLVEMPKWEVDELRES